MSRRKKAKGAASNLSAAQQKRRGIKRIWANVSRGATTVDSHADSSGIEEVPPPPPSWPPGPQASLNYGGNTHTFDTVPIYGQTRFQGQTVTGPHSGFAGPAMYAPAWYDIPPPPPESSPPRSPPPPPPQEDFYASHFSPASQHGPTASYPSSNHASAWNHALSSHLIPTPNFIDTRQFASAPQLAPAPYVAPPPTFTPGSTYLAAQEAAPAAHLTPDSYIARAPSVDRAQRDIRARNAVRAPSVVRELRKDRDKPYKREFKKSVVPKKPKANYKTTSITAPNGYTFLPLGTGDLAERCTALSRQLNFPVHIVDAKPRSWQASDPNKVSHHIHRIGYHFKTEVLEQAVEELGYVLSAGHYIKEEELCAERRQEFMIEVLRRHGAHVDQPTKRETAGQVGAAIKELFPNIPDLDLNEIVEHAWREGTDRIGTQEHVSLPRRVQLAVIARIRHKYTDYDRTLRAYSWEESRKMVEQALLKKLLEWRGEDGAEDEGAFEEIVRETIIIDDDDDKENEAGGSEADGEETDMERGGMQYTARLAGEEDLRPESAQGPPKSFWPRSRRDFTELHPSQRKRYEENLVRMKIEDAREEMRMEEVTRVYVPDDGTVNGPQAVTLNGQTFYRETLPPPQGLYQPHYVEPQRFTPERMQHLARANEHYPRPEYHERVQPSIERDTMGPAPKREVPYAQWPARVIDLTTPEPYDPRQPMLQPVHGAPAPVQQMPRNYER